MLSYFKLKAIFTYEFTYQLWYLEHKFSHLPLILPPVVELLYAFGGDTWGLGLHSFLEV